MVSAVNAVRNGQMGYKSASARFGVPRCTLQRYVNMKESAPEQLVGASLGRKPALGSELESELARHCIDIDGNSAGLRGSDIKRMAYQLALQNGIQHPFSMKTGLAGKKWLSDFLVRHPEVALRMEGLPPNVDKNY